MYVITQMGREMYMRDACQFQSLHLLLDFHQLCKKTLFCWSNNFFLNTLEMEKESAIGPYPEPWGAP